MSETDSSIILAAPAEFTPDHPSIIATPNAVGGVGGNDDVGSSPNVGGGVNLAVTHPVDSVPTPSSCVAAVGSRMELR